MRRWAAAAGALVAAGAFLLLRRGETEEDAVIRGALSLPTPTRAEKLLFFRRLMDSGERVTLGSLRPSPWQEIGERTFVSFGTEAFDHLFGEERTADYRNAPTLLLNALRLAAEARGANESARFVPFLLYWLDPSHCPPNTAETPWADEIRRSALLAALLKPDPRFRPVCERVLAEEKPAVDARVFALEMLFRLGGAETVARLYETLPPNAAEPKGDLKIVILDRVRRMAGEREPEESRAGARSFLPLLERLLSDPDPLFRVRALGALLKMGREEMADRLASEHDRLLESDPKSAFFALQTLAEERAHPRCRERFLALVRETEVPPERQPYAESALAFLAWRWIDDPEVSAELWRIASGSHLLPAGLLAALARADRPRVAGIVREAIRSDDAGRRRDAVNFARSLPLAEAAPEILERLRQAATDAERGFYYGVLTAFRYPPVLPLLRSDLAAADPALRLVAAACLFDWRDAEGLGRLAARLEAAPEEFLDPILQRVGQGGPDALPESLLPALCRLVRRHPSEGVRLRALYTIRAAGRLEPVRESLLDAYRREPSDDAARAIRAVLLELSHR